MKVTCRAKNLRKNSTPKTEDEFIAITILYGNITFRLSFEMSCVIFEYVNNS